MTDPPDVATRFREVNDDIAKKGRWLRELRRRTDSNGQRTDEQDREARRAAGIPAPNEQEHA